MVLKWNKNYQTESLVNKYSRNNTENILTPRLINKFKREREDSASEDDIPFFELAKRLKTSPQSEKLSQVEDGSSDSRSAIESHNNSEQVRIDESIYSNVTDDEMSGDAMSINQVARDLLDCKEIQKT